MNIETIIIFIAITTMGLTACNQSSDGLSSNDMPTQRSPRVLAHSPDGGADNVSIKEVVSITFDSDLNSDTLTSKNITLLSDKPIKGIITYYTSTRTVTFKPYETLQPNTEYTITLSNKIADNKKQSLPASFTFHFKTEPFIQKSSPKNKTPATARSPVISTTNRNATFYPFATHKPDGNN